MSPRRALPLLAVALLPGACGKDEPSPDLSNVRVEASLTEGKSHRI